MRQGKKGKKRSILRTVTAAQIVILFFYHTDSSIVLPFIGSPWFHNVNRWFSPIFIICAGPRLEELVSSSSSHGESQGKNPLIVDNNGSPRPHEQVSININKAWRKLLCLPHKCDDGRGVQLRSSNEEWVYEILFELFSSSFDKKRSEGLARQISLRSEDDTERQGTNEGA
jgi:hypothetical protein